MKDEKIELDDRLIAKLPDQKQKGKTSAHPCFNGNMFSFVDKNGEFAFAIPKRGKRSLSKNLLQKNRFNITALFAGTSSSARAF